MEDNPNHQDDIDIDINGDDSDDEGYEYTPGGDCTFFTTLSTNSLQRLKQNDPSLTNIVLALSHFIDGKYFFNSIDWKVNGDCIASNTQLEKLAIIFGRHNHPYYILGDEGHNLPTRQQLQDFFSCVYRNSSVKYISIELIQIDNEFGGGLIEGLSGHQSLETLIICNGSIESIGCTAIGEVLKHPASKVKHLSLIKSQLDDNGLSIVCDSLLGNSTLKKLDLSDNRITSVGWQRLLPVLQHPSCKLIELGLVRTGINDERANILGNALHGTSSLKELNLTSNESVSSAGWQRLFNQLSETTIVHLQLVFNNIDDAGLAALATVGSLNSLDLRRNQSITPSGWRTFFILLQRIRIQLKKLSISGNNVGDEGIDALGKLLSTKALLKTLELNELSDYGPGNMITSSVSSQEWISLFTKLKDSNNLTKLVELHLQLNHIDDEGLRHLVSLVSSMSSLKYLNLNSNRRVSPAGWQALSDYLQSPNFALKEICLDNNNINDDAIIKFAGLLVHNKTLEWLDLYECLDDDDYFLITERGWEALSTLVCNKTSIMDTYNSNHTLRHVGDHNAMNLRSYLHLNSNKDKVEVARQKILQTHFSDNDTSKIQELLDMELKMIPAAIAWIGRPTSIDWTGKKVSGLSTMFNLMRRLPDLFDSTAQKKPGIAAKRKRGIV